MWLLQAYTRSPWIRYKEKDKIMKFVEKCREKMLKYRLIAPDKLLEVENIGR